MPKQTPLAEPPTKQSVHSFENTEDSFERGIRPVEFAGADRIIHRGFMVEKRTRQVLPNEEATVLAETSYVTVSNNGNLLQTFDSGLVYPLGVQAEVAVFPFTTGKSIQLFLSQDVPRGGCQWVIDLDKEMRVIFDGKEFRVGREASDFSVVDFDHDGNYEILVFLTDFYKLHDKMSMALIPLPYNYFPIRYDLEEVLSGKSRFRQVHAPDNDTWGARRRFKSRAT